MSSKRAESIRYSILMPLELLLGEGIFEINRNEVVKEDEHTMYNISIYSD